MTAVALALSLLLLLIAAALRAGGASLVTTHRADALYDAAEGNPRAATVAELLDDRNRIQPAIGMVHSATLVAAVLPAGWAMAEAANGWPLALALAGLGLAVILIGDLLPRSLGRHNPRILAYQLVPILRWAVAIGGRASDFLLEEEEDTEEVVEQESQDREEIDLISSVLDFSDTIVREVMVPRTDMVTIRENDVSDLAVDIVVEHGYSRLPVTGEGLDDIRGIVYAKDLLRFLDEGSAPAAVAQLMRSAYFVPETKRVSDLLRDMQSGKVHIAVVVDESGGTAGIVTIEDLIEELVGEIVDEHDTEEAMVEVADDGSYLVDARLPVEELSELLGVDLPDEEWDTVGGLVLGLAGRVPFEGETFEVEGIILTATRVQGRRVAQVTASRLDA
ncbi:MAG: hemolysin family protein [Acidimicrobiia bacterium]|nr:hemolysin family protein [Acidimicrobiia bacterium]